MRAKSAKTKHLQLFQELTYSYGIREGNREAETSQNEGDFKVWLMWQFVLFMSKEKELRKHLLSLSLTHSPPDNN